MRSLFLGVVEPIPVGQAAKDYLARHVNPTLLKGLTELCKKKPKEPIVNNRFFTDCCQISRTPSPFSADLVGRLALGEQPQQAQRCRQYGCGGAAVKRNQNQTILCVYVLLLMIE